ncbi:MAG: A/G-specific adenine glycosylase [Terriglobales bacterium]
MTAAAKRKLLAWYAAERRDLPWRRPERAGDSYAVWVSEVMLQQTRVAAAEGYYRRFLGRFPRLAALAAAKESEVLALWSGLGYYRRARQMWRTARAVRAAGSDALPEVFAELLALPGFGRYTAGAVLSIARQQPYPAVDGNIRRVLWRLAGRALTGAEAEAAGRDWLDLRRPGDSNQALMELGAMVCLPRRPRCGECPIRRWCRDRGRDPGLTARARRAAEAVREEYWLVVREGRVRLRRRAAAEALLPGMWELPRRAAGDRGGRLLGTVRHAITFRTIKAAVYAPTPGTPAPPGRWWTRSECERLPLTGLAQKILRRWAKGTQEPAGAAQTAGFPSRKSDAAASRGAHA